MPQRLSVPAVVEGASGGPRSCGRNTCTWCVFSNVERVTAAIDLAEPSGMVTLTLAGSDSETISSRMTRFRQYTRRVIPSWQDCWTAETYQAGTHVHAWFTGPVPDPSDLAGPVHSARLGSDIRVTAHDPIKVQSGQRFDYALKSATDNDPAFRQTFLDINSSRLAHPSRGFFRDGRDGPAIPGGINGVTALSSRRSPDPTQPVRVVSLVGG